MLDVIVFLGQLLLILLESVACLFLGLIGVILTVVIAAIVIVVIVMIIVVIVKLIQEKIDDIKWSMKRKAFEKKRNEDDGGKRV